MEAVRKEVHIQELTEEQTFFDSGARYLITGEQIQILGYLAGIKGGSQAVNNQIREVLQDVLKQKIKER